MDIITYVLDGALRHADSTGAGSIVRPGEIQRMSAGTGVRHSETNASATDTLHLLQIWIVPDRVGIAPDYEQKNFPADRQRNQPILVASPDGRDGSVTVRQDAKLFLGRLDDGCGIVHPLAAGRGAWLQVARGLIGLNGTEMREGDGAAVEGEPFLTIEADTDAEILLFDLA